MKFLLSELKEVEYLNDILESFYLATGIHAEAISMNGEALYKQNETNRCEFCKIVRVVPGGESRCSDSYKRAATEAAKWKEPYFFRCHAGLVMWAVPIIIWGEAIGSIICGQVLLWKPDDFFWREQEFYISRYKQFDKLIVAAQKLEVVSAERTQAAADLLFIMVNHVVARNVRALEEVDKANRVQQKLRQKMQQRDKTQGDGALHYESYLKKERKLLQNVRLGDKAGAESNLITIFSDLFIIAKGKASEISQRVFELCCLVSRSAVEGGVDADRSMEILENYDLQINEIGAIYHQANKIIEHYLEEIFAFTDKKHVGMVKRAREFILDNYQKPIKVDDIAEYLFISPSHLSRLFRQELNCTVLEYLTRVRIEKALELLKSNEYSVEKVSKLVGFKYSSYFVRIFKKHVGVTPLTYRNKLF